MILMKYSLNSALVLVVYTKEQLTLLGGKLGEHRTHPKGLPVVTDIVPKNMGENFPIFKAPIDFLVACPDLHLHHQLLGRGDVIIGALDLVSMPAIAIVGLNVIIPLNEVGEDSIKNLEVWPRANWVQTLNPSL
jgi:hypothetical protein